jgi:ABC-2 type transport system permease protein
MARSAVLARRTIADHSRNVLVVILTVSVGLLVGFRFHNGFLPATAAIGLTLLIGVDFSRFFALTDFIVRDREAPQADGFVPSVPLGFASGAFTPSTKCPAGCKPSRPTNP